MKVWITKFAFTQGIIEAEAEVVLSAGDGKMIKITSTTRSFATYYHKPFWYVDKKEAVIHAESLRWKKIASLEKQLKKLNNLKF